MKYLAIDSAAARIGLILSVDGKIYFSEQNNDRKASEVLLADIDALLNKAKITLSELDFFAVITGPGSFTGIRIGVNTVKSFAYALNKPVIAVTAFEKAAYNKLGSASTACVIKAYASLCFMCVIAPDRSVITPVECISYEDAAARIKENGYSVVADEESLRILGKGRKDDRKKAFAACVEQKAKDNEFVSYRDVEPYYLLVSQAERELKAKNA